MITGVYGSGKSSVAAEIAHVLEQQGEPYALLDLDYLGWTSTVGGDHVTELRLMLRSLADVASNYRQAGIRLFVLAYFVRDAGLLQGVRGSCRPAAASRAPDGSAV